MLSINCVKLFALLIGLYGSRQKSDFLTHKEKSSSAKVQIQIKAISSVATLIKTKPNWTSSEQLSN